MTTLTTRCPHCKTQNRIPEERLNEVATCGSCNEKLLDGKPIEGTSDNLATLLKSDKPVVLDFWAPWCGPCVNFAPVFESAAALHDGEIRFVKIDTEAQQALAAQYRIRSIPTIMIFKDGEVVETINGALPQAQFNQWLEQSLAKA